MASGDTAITAAHRPCCRHAGVGPLQGAWASTRPAGGSADGRHVGELQSLGEDPDLDIEGQWFGGLSAGGNERFVEPITKRAHMVTSSDTLFDMVVRAGEMAQRAPMGPVYLDVGLEQMLHDWTPPASAKRDVQPAPKMQAAPEEVENIAALIRNAKNPVIVTETAGRDPAAYEAMIAFAEALAIPVIIGRNATFANFPSNHPLYLGVTTYNYVAESDLVLMVGCRAPWYPPHKRPTDGKLVLIR